MMLQGQWTPEELLELLQSPPFRQQVDSFTYVRNWTPMFVTFHFGKRVANLRV